MEKNYLFDVDGLLQVLQAIKEERPVEYRPLEEPNWRDFNPEEYDIDTENCMYRVKPCEYGEHIGDIVIPPALLQEGVIYYVECRGRRAIKQSIFCVRSNSWQEDNMISLHFYWSLEGDAEVLRVNDVNEWGFRSEKTDTFGNLISSEISLMDPDKFQIYLASKKMVEKMESRLRDVGYELKDGQMKRIDGNKA